MFGELPSVFDATMRRARKEHTCCECKQSIRIGDLYELAKGCWNGKWDSFKTCDTCADLRRQVEDIIDCAFDDPICFGELREMCEEYNLEFTEIREARPLAT
jgi:hypothetical protein